MVKLVTLALVGTSSLLLLGDTASARWRRCCCCAPMQCSAPVAAPCEAPAAAPAAPAMAPQASAQTYRAYSYDPLVAPAQSPAYYTNAARFPQNGFTPDYFGADRKIRGLDSRH